MSQEWGIERAREAERLADIEAERTRPHGNYHTCVQKWHAAAQHI